MTRIALVMLTALNIFMLSGCATTHTAGSQPAGFSPLYMAVITNNETQVRSLLTAGVDVNGKTISDFTPLTGAAITGNTNMAKLLIEKGANVNCVAIDASTPVMWAAQLGKTEMVKLLIANGADISMRNVLGKTALDMATARNHPEISGILMGTTDSPQPPGVAMQQQKVEPEQNKNALKALITNNDMKGLAAYLDEHPEALSDIEDERLRLLYTGPAKLRIVDIVQLVKNKKKDAIIIAKINSTAGPYKDFTNDEMAELQKMDISDEVVAAMIASTTEWNKTQKRMEASQETAQPATAKKVVKRKKSSQQPVPAAQESTQQPEQAPQVAESNTVSDCLKLGVALKACEHAGGFLSIGCKALARSQFNCPSL
jgi:hypothetical protein